MQKALTLYQTTIGKKAVMALSGLILFGFVIGHLLGNLQVYHGAYTFNSYANGLRNLPALLWIARFALIFAVLAHLRSAFELWSRNKAARPTPYARPPKDLATYYAAKTMYWTGPILLLFIAYHLAHLTGGWTGGLYPYDPTNPYNNLVHGFQHWYISAIYILGNLALGTHLFHGIWSMFQSIGANHPRYNHWRRYLAVGAAILITAGNLSFPIAVMAGFVAPTAETFDFPNLR